MRKKNNNLNVVFDCHYHVVWCTKYRRKVITSNDDRLENNPLVKDNSVPVDERLKEILFEIADEFNFSIDELEVMPDHVHLLISCDPQFGISKVVKLLKGRSSFLLRNEFSSIKSRLPSLWTNSYFVATTGGASLDVIKKYIEDQKNV